MTGQGPVPPPAEDRVASAAGYIHDHRERFTRDALTANLTASGYTPEEIAEAWRRSDAEAVERSAADASGRSDRRNLVALIIAAAYLLTWGVFTIGWLTSEPPGTVALVAGIFAVALLIPGVIALVLVRSWDRLREASVGTVVAALIVPIVVLVGIAGLCVATFPPFGGVA
jgi:hypothetical protein